MRENRGAEGAEGDEIWKGVSPFPSGEGSGDCAPSPNFFCLAMVHFGAFWALVLIF